MQEFEATSEQVDKLKGAVHSGNGFSTADILKK